MTPVALIFVLVAAVFLIRVPKQWAPLPLMAGACYMTLGQAIEIGPLNFTVIRILVAVGVVRVMIRGERIGGGMNRLDRMMVGWGIFAAISSVFHDPFSSALVYRLGWIYDSCGFYFLLRIFLQGADSVYTITRIIIIVLIPVALEMISERLTGKNSFSFLGGVSMDCEVRDGKIRAQGPFSHSILAGTVGAVCWPLALLFWKQNRKLAVTGLVTGMAIVLASKSSGPIMTTMLITGGLFVWKIRQHTKLIRRGVLVLIVLCHFAMEAPVYYLLARIDLTGSSTGWHRAELINAAIIHLNEWWVGGTDRTRHWMPSGVDWNKNHTDITNHYIKMGVIGGLPLMLMFIGVVITGFKTVGEALRASKDLPPEKRFVIWIFGAILLGHALTFVSVCYFDQSIVFFLLILAIIGSLRAQRTVSKPVAPQSAPLTAN